MDLRRRHRLLTALACAALATGPVALVAQAPDSLPPGVTPETLQRGRVLYQGAGLCLACHGVDGKGTTLGPNLVDAEWLHTDGSFEAIVRIVLSGVEQRASKTGQMMPPRGGSSLKDEEVRAVAAYVWALNRGVKIP
jgi:mono/diheme cytochrome c family protein